MIAAETVVRPLRTAIIHALQAADTTAGDRVFTPPVAEEAGFPRLVIDGYAESPANFFSRPGSRFRALVKGHVQSRAGDLPREQLWEQTYRALHRQPIAVDGHIVLYGTLRRTATYMDPDGITLHFVGTYDAETKMEIA